MFLRIICKFFIKESIGKLKMGANQESNTKARLGKDTTIFISSYS